MASFILLPTYLEISASSRSYLDINGIFNSKLGPLFSKPTYLLSSGLGIMSCFLLLKRNKLDKFNKFLLITLIFLLMPILIEPINKLLHLGSYVYYPYRYGFITCFFLLYAGCAYFSLEKENKQKNHKIISCGITILSSISILLLSYKFYNRIQVCIDKLTFSADKLALIIMIVILLIIILSTFILDYLTTNNKQLFWMLSPIIATSILCFGMFYFSIDYDRNHLDTLYDDMNNLYTEIKSDYHIKIENYEYTDNSSWISNLNTYDNFTSLIGNNPFTTMQKLGYHSYWMNTMSSGGNLFNDLLLNMKYLLTPDKIDREGYKLIGQYNNLYLHESLYQPSFGYLFSDNVSVLDTNNSFEITNRISNQLMGQDAFTIVQDFEYINLQYKNNELILEKNPSIVKTLKIDNKKTIYLEIFNSLYNKSKQLIYNNFDIYVNDQLYLEGYPHQGNINTILLGTFENTTVTVKIVPKNDCNLEFISLGVLDNSKLDYFKESNNAKIEYDKNNIKITYDSQSDGLLFLPINYLKGMQAKINNVKTAIVPMMNNFIGIKVQQGENNIYVSYTPDGLKLGSILSFLGLIFTLIFVKYKELFIHPITSKIAYIIYKYLWLLAIILFYLFPFIIFILSFVHTF